MPTQKLTPEQLAGALVALNQTVSGWSLHNEKLTKEYKFTHFQHAFGFMTICALYCEKVNHHPEWSNVYNRVNVQLTTHDAGGISDKDLALAQQMDGVYASLSR
jgi:4a-hydroxytetrahydrobiopterin dehydratase